MSSYRLLKKACGLLARLFVLARIVCIYLPSLFPTTHPTERDAHNTHIQPGMILYGSRGSRSPLIEWYLIEINKEYTHEEGRAGNPNPFGQIPGLTDDNGVSELCANAFEYVIVKGIRDCFLSCTCTWSRKRIISGLVTHITRLPTGLPDMTRLHHAYGCVHTYAVAYARRVTEQYMKLTKIGPSKL